MFRIFDKNHCINAWVAHYLSASKLVPGAYDDWLGIAEIVHPDRKHQEAAIRTAIATFIDKHNSTFLSPDDFRHNSDRWASQPPTEQKICAILMEQTKDAIMCVRDDMRRGHMETDYILKRLELDHRLKTLEKQTGLSKGAAERIRRTVDILMHGDNCLQKLFPSDDDMPTAESFASLSEMAIGRVEALVAMSVKNPTEAAIEWVIENGKQTRVTGKFGDLLRTATMVSDTAEEAAAHVRKTIRAALQTLDNPDRKPLSTLLATPEAFDRFCEEACRQLSHRSGWAARMLSDDDKGMERQ